MEPSILGQFAPCGQHYAQIHPYASDLPRPERAGNAKSSTLLGDQGGPPSYHLQPGGCPDVINKTSVRTKLFDDRNFDEEIYISGSTVFWMQGNILNKSFSFQNRNCNVRQTFWAWFPISVRKGDAKADGTELQRVLCIFFGETAELYVPNGKSFTVEFPFFVERAWPLHLGFLIQREPTVTPMTPIGMSDYADLPDATLYDLSHPLEPIRAVTISKKIYRENGSQMLKAVGPTHPFHDVDKSVLLVTDHNFTSKLIITRDRGSGQLRVWRYAIRMGDAFTYDSFTEDFRSCMFSEQEADFWPSNALSGFANLEPAYVGGSVVQEICTLASPKSRSEGDTKAFMAHSIDGSEVLVIFEPSVRLLTGFAVTTTADHMQIRQLFEHKASAALPVCGTRLDQLDILLLQPDGSLYLWIGSDLMAMCTIGDDIKNDMDEDGRVKTAKRRREIVPLAERLSPQFRNQDPAEFSLFSDSEYNVYRSPSRAARIVDLKDAVCDRVNLVLSNGLVYRASFDFLSKSSLVQSCITALYCTLPASLFQSLFLRYLYFEYGGATHGGEPCHHDEWESFGTVLLSLCKPPAGHPLKSSQDCSSSVPLKISTDESDEDGDADWDRLLSSAYHSEHKNDAYLQGLSLPNSNSCEGLKKLHQNASKLRCERTPDASLGQYLHIALLSLHLVYEDLKLYAITSKETTSLGGLLAQLSFFVGWDDYVDYYGRDGVLDETAGLLKGRISVPELPELQKEWEFSPPNIHQWLYHRCQGRPYIPFPTLNDIRELRGHPSPSDGNQSWISKKRSACERTSAICEFHQELARSDNGSEAMVLKMVERGFKLADLDTLPFGVALPFREAIRHCREFPSKSWPEEAYLLIGRQDLVETSRGMFSPSVTCRHLDKNLKHQPPADIESICRSSRLSETEEEADSPQEDGTDIMNHDVTDLKFGHDLRLQEVQKLLQSVRPPKVIIPERKAENGDEYTKMQQSYVLALCHRTFALPVGRGLLTYGTSTTMPTEEFPIPGIALAVRSMPLDVPVTLDKSAFHTRYFDWPEFHDGVAAALRINSRYSKVSSSWTVYNCVQHDPDNYHVGFLLGLGLNGHLQDLKFVHCFNILTPHHELAMIALLLGLAISYQGTMHARVMSLLTLHVSEFCEPDRTPLSCPSLARAACVIGIGLLHMGTANRKTAERMLRQVGYLEQHASESRRMFQETYSLAAGFSLGFIMLGRGKEAFGLSNQVVVDQLRRYMGAREGGGIDDNLKRDSKGKFGAGKEEGMEGLHRAQVTDDGLNLVHDDIHTDITAPGATVAFGLVYMRTNDAEIAAKLTIPESTYALDQIRPDLLLLRVLSRNLILWDSITPTNDWVLSHLPRYIHDPMVRDLKDFGKAIGPDENPNIDSIRHAWTNIIAGACFSIGLKYAGSADPKAFHVLLKYLDLFISLSGIVATNFESKILRCAVKIALDVLCTSIACVMAGTGNLLVMKRLRKLHGRVSADTPTYGHHMASHMALGLLFLGGGQYTLGTSNKAVGALVCALYPQYPIKPDDTAPHLQALRHLWALAVEPRCFVTRDVETRQSVYAPISVVVYDDDSSSLGDRAQEMRPTKRMEMVSPCLLPDLACIKSITVRSPRYWPVELDFTASSKPLETILSGKAVFVKRIAGHLSYAEDLKGFMGIRSQYFAGAFAAEDVNVPGFSAAFSADPLVAKYAQHFCQSRIEGDGCNDGDNDSTIIAAMKANVGETDAESSSLASFCSSVLYECLARDELELVPVFLGLYHAVKSLGKPQQLRTLWNVKLLLAHYERLHDEIQNSSHAPPPLDNDDEQGEWNETSTPKDGYRPSPIREAYLSSLREQLDSFFDLGSSNTCPVATTKREERQALIAYIENCTDDEDSSVDTNRNPKSNPLLSQESFNLRYWIASRLVYHDVPEPRILKGIDKVVRETKDESLASAVLQLALPNLSFDTLQLLIGRGNEGKTMSAT